MAAPSAALAVRPCAQQKDRGALVIAAFEKEQLDAAKSIGADQVVALDD